MISRIVATWSERRAFADADPYTEDELARLREVPAEGKAIRRHRRRTRPQLLKRGES